MNNEEDIKTIAVTRQMFTLFMFVNKSVKTINIFTSWANKCNKLRVYKIIFSPLTNKGQETEGRAPERLDRNIKR